MGAFADLICGVVVVDQQGVASLFPWALDKLFPVAHAIPEHEGEMRVGDIHCAVPDYPWTCCWYKTGGLPVNIGVLRTYSLSENPHSGCALTNESAANMAGIFMKPDFELNVSTDTDVKVGKSLCSYSSLMY